MNIGLLIRGAKAGAKLAKSAANATGRGAKAGAKATGKRAKSAARATSAKAKGAAKAVAKSKVAQGAKRVGGKVVENVGYAATPGLRRSVVAGAGKGSTRYFKKAAGTGAIKSIAKAQVKRTGKKVVGGAAAIGTGYGTTKAVQSKRASNAKKSKAAAAAKAKRDAAAAKARAATSKVGSKPAAKPASKKVSPKGAGATKKAIPAYARLGKKSGTRPRTSRFDAMSPAKIKKLRGKDKLMYRHYLSQKKK
jgi:hypothetical protein